MEVFQSSEKMDGGDAQGLCLSLEVLGYGCCACRYLSDERVYQMKNVGLKMCSKIYTCPF